LMGLEVDPDTGFAYLSLTYRGPYMASGLGPPSDLAAFYDELVRLQCRYKPVQDPNTKGPVIGPPGHELRPGDPANDDAIMLVVGRVPGAVVSISRMHRLYTCCVCFEQGQLHDVLSLSYLIFGPCLSCGPQKHILIHPPSALRLIYRLEPVPAFYQENGRDSCDLHLTLGTVPNFEAEAGSPQSAAEIKGDWSRVDFGDGIV
jgi:hypothetical protein